MMIVDANRLECRKIYNLPMLQPKSKGGVTCGDCVNNCVLAEDELGFCNLVTNKNGKKVRIAGDDIAGGLFSFYHDPLPTNCVAEP
ncbi:MAG: radical SAM protein, partial [Candidatus Heimdallarchaeota archaeon]